MHPLPAQGTRATLALRAYIMRKRPIRELSRFDAICEPIAICRNEACHFRMHFSFALLASLAPHLCIDFDAKIASTERSSRLLRENKLQSPMHY